MARSTVQFQKGLSMAEFNERFGTDFNQADQLFFDQIVEAAMTEPWTVPHYEAGWTAVHVFHRPQSGAR